MKTKYRSRRLVLLIVCVMGLGACSTSDDNELPPEEITVNITLDQNTLKMNVGDEEQLRVNGAEGQKVTWSSSDPSVATVENGIITNYKGGEAVISAKVNTVKASCTLSVAPDVFIAGLKYDSEGLSTPYYWKNGTGFPLPDVGSSLQVNAIYLDGTDIYVTGSARLTGNSSILAIIWKNGQAIPLSDDSQNAAAKDIFVVNGDVYVVGSKSTNSESTAILWNNGKEMILPDNNGNSEANSVYVVNGDVHIAGAYQANFNYARAAYWKNGVFMPLGNDSNSYANDILIHQGDVYICGREESQVTHWKNGSPTHLSYGNLEMQGTSIFAFEEDLFMTSNRMLVTATDDIGRIWKNGLDVSATFMPTTSTVLQANSVVVWKKDMHVVGATFEDPNAVGQYWKNGQLQTMEASRGSFFKDIFIR